MKLINPVLRFLKGKNLCFLRPVTTTLKCYFPYVDESIPDKDKKLVAKLPDFTTSSI